MPHITVDGCHMDMNLQQLNVHAELIFRKDFYGTKKATKMIEEIQGKLEKVVEEYFNEIDSEFYSNHEWNTKFNIH